MERAEILNNIYSGQREETRLTRSRHGQLECLTTMDYIHKLVPRGSKVLEVGAGTGRYSIALAGEGYDVTTVELVASNLEVLRRSAAGLENLASIRVTPWICAILRITTLTLCLCSAPCIIYSRKPSSTERWMKRSASPSRAASS